MQHWEMHAVTSAPSQRFNDFEDGRLQGKEAGTPSAMPHAHNMAMGFKFSWISRLHWPGSERSEPALPRPSAAAHT